MSPSASTPPAAVRRLRSRFARVAILLPAMHLYGTLIAPLFFWDQAFLGTMGVSDWSKLLIDPLAALAGCIAMLQFWRAPLYLGLLALSYWAFHFAQGLQTIYLEITEPELFLLHPGLRITHWLFVAATAVGGINLACLGRKLPRLSRIITQGRDTERSWRFGQDPQTWRGLCLGLVLGLGVSRGVEWFLTNR